MTAKHIASLLGLSWKNIVIIALWIFVTNQEGHAQFSRYIIWLKNKGNSSYSLATPAAYLSPRAQERRVRYQIPIDSTDLPVSPSYVSTIGAVPNVIVLNVSKWLNAICIQTTDPSAIATIQSFPFVQNTGGLAARNSTFSPPLINKFIQEGVPVPLPPSTNKQEGTAGDFYSYGNSCYLEMKLHKAEFLHNIGLRGQGMQIAMLDGGFYNYTGLRAFDSVNINRQILSTWDFVSRNATVTDDHTHGMQCLSTIAANMPGQFVGKAPQASFYLFRTEDVNSEFPIEEFNWVCGAEKADSSGADVISSSLGYYDFDNPVFNYTYQQMDGRTTLAVRGADRAAQKGMLVFNSAGNEGTSAWRYIITPADGDSVVAVGAVNSVGAVASFSSYGPSGDGRIKPELASVGVAAVVQSGSGSISAANGTSFSCPNMAGLGTCLWQGFPEFSNMKVIDAMKRSGSKYSNPDTRIGYGIPDLKKAFALLLADFATMTATAGNCQVNLHWDSKDVESMQYLIERKLPGELTYQALPLVSAHVGAVLTNRSYNYSDPLVGVTPGMAYYRLAQWIDTAAATRQLVYLDSASVTLTDPCNALNAALLVYPNPAGANAPVRLVINTPFASQSLLISIHNAAGQKVYQQSSSKAAGAHTIPWDLSFLAGGSYLITVWDGDTKIGTQKLIKSN